MNQEIVNLILLQKLDRRIEKARRAEIEGPEVIAQLEEELAEAEGLLQASLDREQEMQKRRRELEQEIEDTDEKVKQNMTRQLQAKNNEEYRALLKENEYLRKSNSQREDEALELLDGLEQIAKDNKELKEGLENQRKKTAEGKAAVEQEIAASIKAQEGLKLERESLTGDLPKQVMALYNRLYAHRNGSAVVPIENGICMECHIQIPPQSYNDLQRNEELMTCLNCGRIIFWKDHQDFQDIV